MRVRATICLLLLIAAAGEAVGQARSGGESRVIRVSAVGESRVSPDAAQVALAVETFAATAQQAGQDNARAMQRVIDALIRAGVPRDSVETRDYDVFPEYGDAREGGAPRIRGYRAANQVVARVARLDRVGAVIDAALASGANRFQGVQFLVRDPAPARAEALRRAVQRARASAEVIAQALGVPLGPVLEASTATEISRPDPVFAQARMEMAADAPTTPIQPGAQAVQARVSLTFAIAGGS